MGYIFSTLKIGIICLVILPGGALTPQNATNAAPEAQTSSTGVLPDYRIGNGDVLQISVWGQPQLTGAATVRPDGRISLPLVSDVSVSGLTVSEARSLLQDKFSPYVKRPAVSVQVAEVHSKMVYVTGEVQRPGAYLILNPITVVQLVTRAGGATSFAKTKRVYILRPPNGQRIPVNLKAALQGHHSDQDLPLAAGDTVVVP
jgi:polysaccharide biosynthesis/export protein